MVKQAIVRGAGVSKEKRELARGMRRTATEGERRAWEVLRDRRCFGLKFRRQQPIRGYVVDFYCAELRLAIEIDGRVHEDEQVAHRDALRALHLAREANVLVIGITDEAVSAGSLRAIIQIILDETPSPLSR